MLSENGRLSLPLIWSGVASSHPTINSGYYGINLSLLIFCGGDASLQYQAIADDGTVALIKLLLATINECFTMDEHWFW